MGNDVTQYRLAIGTFSFFMANRTRPIIPQNPYLATLFNLKRINLVPITTSLFLLFYLVIIFTFCSVPVNTDTVIAFNPLASLSPLVDPQPNEREQPMYLSAFTVGTSLLQFLWSPSHKLLSTTLARDTYLLKNNHTPKFFNITKRKPMRSGFIKNRILSTKPVVIILPALLIFAIIQLILTLSNDIEVNPGPNLDDVNFNVLYVNTRSLTSNPLKLAEIQHIALVENPAFISISESWLDNSLAEKLYTINNYTVISRKDRDRHGGGIILYARDDIDYSRREEFEKTGIDSIWVSTTHSTNKKSIFGFFYRTPSMKKAELDKWMDDFEAVVQDVKYKKFTSINIFGDFNAKNRLWYPDGDNNIAGIILHSILSRQGLSQLINEPTRVVETLTGTCKSCLDLIITDTIPLVMNSIVLPKLHNCDHCPVLVSLKFFLPMGRPFFRTIFDYRILDMEVISENFSNAPFDSLFDSYTQANDLYNAFFSLFFGLVNASFPTKTIKVDPKSQPWFNAELKARRRKMMRLHKIHKRTKNDDDYTIYSNARSDYHNRIEEMVEEYDNKVTLKLINGKPNDKKYWKLARSLLNKPPQNAVPPIIHNGEVISSPDEKAEVMNDFFCSQASIDDNNLALPRIAKFQGMTFAFDPITTEEVGKILNGLDPCKSSGPDGIPTKILIICKDYIAPVLAKMFNICLDQGVFPEELKQANIIPIFKKGNRQDPTNYRPIALTNQLAKIFEKLIFVRLNTHLSNINFLSECQSGFRKNDSTVQQLIKLVHDIAKSLDKHEETKSIYLDISKAFVKVWHSGLLHKMENLCGIQGLTLKFFKSYLSGRVQKVVMENMSSGLKRTTAGVPQGSILGPLLFLIYINDITTVVTNPTHLFADDTSISKSFTDPAIGKTELEKDALAVNKWGKDWCVKFNTAKTISITYSREKPPSSFPITFGTDIIEDSPKHKHLGLFLSLTFHGLITLTI